MQITKSLHGWRAESQIPVPDSPDKVLVLLTLRRSNGQLVTTANVNIVEGKFLSHRMFHDFSKRVDSELVRVTEKAVATQHERACANLPQILEEVKNHYVKHQG